MNGDAAACDCRVENFTLTMSWACFCAKFTCTDRQPACGSNRTAYPGCGLTADNLHTVGGPWISVWDESGALVGRHYSSDTSDYQCPSDPNLHAGQVRAGRFPDATCAEVPCTCTGGAMTCAAPDGGADARDGGGADAGGGGTGGVGGTGGSAGAGGTGGSGGAGGSACGEPASCEGYDNSPDANLTGAITCLTPSATAANTGFTLAIFGHHLATGAGANAIVIIGSSSPLNGVPVSACHLDVAVPASAIASPGPKSVVVSPGGRIQDSAPATLTVQ